MVGTLLQLLDCSSHYRNTSFKKPNLKKDKHFREYLDYNFKYNVILIYIDIQIMI